MASGALKIGEVARYAGVGAKAIRFCETRGVPPAPSGGENGYRLYGVAVTSVVAAAGVAWPRCLEAARTGTPRDAPATGLTPRS